MTFHTQCYSTTSSSNGTFRISGTDTTPGYAVEKLIAGSGISIDQENIGGNEFLLISATGVTGTYITEIPSDSGDHTNFSVSHEPILGTFQLYRGGALQETIQAPVDYTISGVDITLIIPLSTGETLIAVYQY